VSGDGKVKWCVGGRERNVCEDEGVGRGESNDEHEESELELETGRCIIVNY